MRGLAWTSLLLLPGLLVSCPSKPGGSSPQPLVLKVPRVPVVPAENRDELEATLLLPEPGKLALDCKPLPAGGGAAIAQAPQQGQQLTPGEERLLYGWVTPDGRHCYSHDTIIDACAYYRDMGRLPPTAAQLLAYKSRRNPLPDPKNLSPSEVIDHYAEGINPVTGEFYQTYSSPAWSPGGIYIKALSDDEIRKSYPGWTGSNGRPLPSVFAYKLFGEKEGSVLLEDTIVNGSAPPTPHVSRGDSP
jgi:hypothetical protein